MGQDTTKGDSGTDQGIQLFVTADGELEMAGSDALDLEILGSVSCKFEDFGGQVLEDGGDIDSSFGTNPHLVLGVGLEETLDTTARELKTGTSRVALLLLGSISGGSLPA